MYQLNYFQKNPVITKKVAFNRFSTKILIIFDVKSTKFETNSILFVPYYC